jgi:hypothetical protein
MRKQVLKNYKRNKIPKFSGNLIKEEKLEFKKPLILNEEKIFSFEDEKLNGFKKKIITEKIDNSLLFKFDEELEDSGEENITNIKEDTFKKREIIVFKQPNSFIKDKFLKMNKKEENVTKEFKIDSSDFIIEKVNIDNNIKIIPLFKE